MLGPARRAHSTFVGGCVIGAAATSEHPASLPRPALPCSLVDGVMTYEMTRFVIDAQKAVVHKAQPDQKVRQHGGLHEGDDCQPGVAAWAWVGQKAVVHEAQPNQKAAVLPLQQCCLSLSDLQASPPACVPLPLARLRTWSLRRARCTPLTAWCPPARASPSEGCQPHRLSAARVVSHVVCEGRRKKSTAVTQRTSSVLFKQDFDLEGVLATSSRAWLRTWAWLSSPDRGMWRIYVWPIYTPTLQAARREGDDCVQARDGGAELLIQHSMLIMCSTLFSPVKAAQYWC